MTPYAILAPNLDAYATKLLRVALSDSRLPWVEPVDRLPDDGTRFVLSAGKEALGIWHDFGLIRVHANQGSVFTHVDPVTARTHHLMVVEHPGAMAQMSLTRHDARADMRRNLMAWGWLIANLHRGATMPRSTLCGGCLKAREPRERPAEHWVAELDMVGLCEDHYRKRAQYRRKVKRVARKDKGKMEHQIDGQMEMLPGDGTKVMVSKT